MRITVKNGISLSASPTKLKPEPVAKKDPAPEAGKKVGKKAKAVKPRVFLADPAAVKEKKVLAWLGLTNTVSPIHTLSKVGLLNKKSLTFSRLDTDKVVKVCSANDLPDWLGTDADNKLLALTKLGIQYSGTPLSSPQRKSNESVKK